MTVVRNGGQISNFSSLSKIVKGWVKCLMRYFEFSLERKYPTSGILSRAPLPRDERSDAL